MSKIKLNKLYVLVFLLVVVFCFLIGGFIQLFIGIPNTIFTYGIISLFFAFYILYVLIKKKIYFNKIILLHILFSLIIVVSAIINKTHPIKTAIYFIFVLLPLGTYLFFKINQTKNYISPVAISKLYLMIALIQLPVILIQRFGASFFISFNKSSQYIGEVDFMFGTFFLKADHALGFFLIVNIFNIIENNASQKITRHPKIILFYLSATIFIAESNISKLVLILFLAYLLFKSFPKKFSFFIALLMFFAIPFIINQAKKIDAFEREIYFYHTEYSPKKSFRNYERGIAKRQQIVIVFATKMPLKIIGEGPYSYFNILKGEFTKTKHFSQLIWTYADLGIVGLFVLILLLHALVGSLGLSTNTKFLMFLVVIIYAFMTTILSDLTIMITLLSLLQNRKK